VSGTIEYGGTGFLACDQKEGIEIPFLITCRHVAETLSRHDKFYVRVNTVEGGSENIPMTKMEWSYHPDKSVDLAMIFILIIPPEKFDLRYARLYEEPFLLKSERAACGDLISLIGLFRLHAGRQRNVPFVHSGHIAVLPDPKERVPIRDRITGELIMAEVYLVEAQTLDGLSGSPVFVHEVLHSPVPGYPGDGVARLFGNVRFLGLYSGSWDGEPGQILAEDRDLRGKTRVPVGVGIVIPVDKIVELVRDDDKLKKSADAYVQFRLLREAQAAAASE
jgi:hypothetical protein